MADEVDCFGCAAPLAGDTADEGASVRERTSGSDGSKSLSRTKPDGAIFTGTYLLPSMNFMNFSWAGTTLAGFVKVSKEGSGSAFFSGRLSTCQCRKLA